jgi:arsenite methyltransferase
MVFNSLRARMLNWEASSQRGMPEAILEHLPLQRGQQVADVGTGGGYFAFRMAEQLEGEGTVYAIDVDGGFLRFIQREAERRGIRNLITVQAEGERIPIPEGILDLALFRDVYHHLERQVEYFCSFRTFLQPEGRVVIIDYRPKGSFFIFWRLFEHYASRETILMEMEQAGYRLVEEHTFLPEQYFLIFGI